jgi:uncharacterized protein RhaS with RHS repeats
MGVSVSYSYSAQPDPPSNAAVTTYVYDGYGNLLHVDEAPGTLARLAELKAELLRKPKVEITRDPARHVMSSRSPGVTARPPCSRTSPRGSSSWTATPRPRPWSR